MKRVLVWFQRNLRLADNPALQWALQQGGEVILLYLNSPLEEIPWQRGAASSWWLQQSLRSLQADIEAAGGQLNLLHGNACELIPQLVERYQLDAVSWQRNYEPHLAHRDKLLCRQLERLSVTINISSDGLLAGPEQLLTQKQTPYRVFTPFYRQLRAGMLDQVSLPVGQPLQQLTTIKLAESLTVDGLQLLVAHPWQQRLAHYHQPGEQAAQHRLEQFINQHLLDYPSQRDFPADDSTSQLAASLHFGELSAQQILAALQPLVLHGDARESSSAETFLRQLIWREFARYTLWHNPSTPEQSLDDRFDESFWHYDQQLLTLWQQGKTGIPIIDAGMQQLWQSGTMHNRVRMLVASLLCKNMGQPWQLGARWFWDTLVDADLANNTMGWQWVAGCGVDAAPYFRIFNPLSQAAKFDPQGEYCRRWLGDRLDSPAIIDLAESRQQALARYQQYIKGHAVLV